MVKKSVVWTQTAARQRREVLKYWTIHNQSDTFSLKLLILIKNKIRLILSHPHAGVQTEMTGIRVSVMGHFSIYYKFTDNELIVVGFWDNRQDPKKLVELLKT